MRQFALRKKPVFPAFILLFLFVASASLGPLVSSLHGDGTSIVSSAAKQPHLATAQAIAKKPGLHLVAALPSPPATISAPGLHTLGTVIARRAAASPFVVASPSRAPPAGSATC